MTKLSLLPGYAAYIDYDGRSVSEVLAELEYGDGLSIDTLTATPAEIELGASEAIELAWAITGTVTGQSLDDSVDGAVALADPVADRAVTVAGVDSARTFTLSAENADAPGGIDSKTRSISVAQLPRRFWGVSAAAALDSAGVVALAGSELSGARSKTFAVDGGAGAYAYYAYPASLGDPGSYRIYGFTEDPVQTTVEVTTAAGATLDYIVLRSPNPLTGTIPVEIA